MYIVLITFIILLNIFLLIKFYLTVKNNLGTRENTEKTGTGTGTITLSRSLKVIMSDSKYYQQIENSCTEKQKKFSNYKK